MTDRGLTGGVRPRLEIAWDAGMWDDGPWSDLMSDYVVVDGVPIGVVMDIDCDRGNEAYGDINVAKLTVKLNNYDGRFTAGNVYGPYYGKLTQDKPIRFVGEQAAATIVDNLTNGSGLNQIDYTGGTWSNTGTDQPHAYLDAYGYSNTMGDYFEVDFVGSQVAYWSYKGANLGIVALSVDGGAETLVDLYSGTTVVTAELWRSPLLAYGAHTFRCRVTGTKNPSSSGFYGIADRVDVEDSLFPKGRFLTASWRPSESFGNVPTVELVAYDTLWAPGRKQVDGVGWTQQVLARSPLTLDAYLRLGDTDSASVATNAQGGTDGLYILGPRQRGNGLVPFDPDTGADIGAGGKVMCYGMNGTGGNTLMFLVNPASFPTSPTTWDLFWKGDGTAGNTLKLHVTSTGAVVLTFPPTPTVLSSASFGWAMVQGQTNLIILSRSAAGDQWTFAGYNAAGSGGFSSTSNPAWNVNLTGPNLFGATGPAASAVASGFQGVIDEIAIWHSALPAIDLAHMYTPIFYPGQTISGVDETPDLRFTQLLNLTAVPDDGAWRVNPALIGPYLYSMALDVYPSSPGGSVLDGLRTLAKSETSRLYADNIGRVVRVPYSSVVPDVVTEVDDEPNTVNPKASAREPVLGEFDARNRINATDSVRYAVLLKDGVTTEAVVEESVSSFKGLYPDLVRDLAERAGRARFDPEQRLAPVTVSLAAQGSASARSAVLKLDLNDQFAETRDGVTTVGRVCRIHDHVFHSGGESDWTVEISTEPNPATYVATARALGFTDQSIATGTGFNPVAMPVAGESWDTDAMHVAQKSDRVHLHPDRIHLVNANVMWDNATTPAGYRLIDVGRTVSGVSHSALGRVSAFGVADGVEGNAQIAGTLFKAIAPFPTDYVDVIGQHTQGANLKSVVSSLRGSSPGTRLVSPSLTVVAFPASTQGCRLRSSTSLTGLTSGPLWIPTYDTEDIDTSGFHSGDPRFIVMPEDGVYFMGFDGSWSANSSGTRTGMIFRNRPTVGSYAEGTADAIPQSATDRTAMHTTALVRVTKGDTFYASATQSSGSTLSLDALNYHSPVFWAVKLDAPSVRTIRYTSSFSHSSTSGGLGGSLDVPVNSPAGAGTAQWDDLDEYAGGFLTPAISGYRLVWAGVRFNGTGSSWRTLAIRDLSGSTSYAQVTVPIRTGTYVQVWTIAPPLPLGSGFRLMFGAGSSGSISESDFGMAMIAPESLPVWPSESAFPSETRYPGGP